MSVIALALIASMQTAPDALTVAHDICVASAGQFEAFDRLASSQGSRLGDDAIRALFPSPRNMGQASGYRVGEVDVVLVDFPGGVRNVPAPIQEAGQPTRMWDYNFPHRIVCRVQADGLGENWIRTMSGWTVQGSRLSPLGVGQTHERAWTFAGGGFVNVQAPEGHPAQIDIVFRAEE